MKTAIIDIDNQTYQTTICSSYISLIYERTLTLPFITMSHYKSIVGHNSAFQGS